MFALRKLFRNHTSVSVAVPREVWTSLGVRPGDYVAWCVLADGRVELTTPERLFPASAWRPPSDLVHGTAGQNVRIRL